MNLFIKKLIKFSLVFGLFVLVQFFFFQLTFKHFIEFNIDNNKSVLILGDSHLQADLNDSIIDGSINLAAGADVTYFSYIKLKRFKEANPHIDTLILGFNWENLYSNDFYHTSVMQMHFGNYFYLMDVDDYQELITNNLEVFIRGTSGMIKNFRKVSWIFSNNDIKSLDLGGFLPRPNNYSNLESSIELEAKKEGNKFEYMDNISQLELSHLIKIVSFCKENNIKLIVLNGPIHSDISNIRKSEKINFLKILGEMDDDLEYWDYENFKVADDLFSDYNHLNANGADIFSKVINNKLKDSLSVLDN